MIESSHNKAAARIWAQAGAAGIVIAARSAEKLATISQELKLIDPDVVVLAVPTDITLESDVKNLYDQVQKKFGRPADVLLNVAGHMEEAKKIGEQGVDAWWRGFVSTTDGLFEVEVLIVFRRSILRVFTQWFIIISRVSPIRKTLLEQSSRSQRVLLALHNQVDLDIQSTSLVDRDLESFSTLVRYPPDMKKNPYC